MEDKKNVKRGPKNLLNRIFKKPVNMKILSIRKKDEAKQETVDPDNTTNE